MPGICADGDVFGNVVGIDNANECLKRCQDNADCAWFTYQPQTELCIHYYDCDALDADLCPECISGNWEKFMLYILLMIVDTN